MMIYNRKIGRLISRCSLLIVLLCAPILSRAQAPTWIDIGWREFLRSVVEMDGQYYAVGTLGYEDETRDAVVVKYKTAEEYTHNVISTPDSNMFFSDIAAHNDRLFVAGAIGTDTGDVYNRHFIGELNTDLELLWKKSYEYYEATSKIYADYIVAGSDKLYVGSLIKIEGIKHGMVNSYNLQGDSLDHYWFETPYSDIDDMTHNLDSTALLLVGERFEPYSGYPTYAELSYDFENILIDDIVATYGRDILSLKQETDSTYIMGGRLSETGFPGGVNGYNQHCLNRMDEQFNTSLLTTQGDFGENEDPGWNNSIDFRNSDTIFFAATHNGAFSYPPPNSSQLWVGYADNQLITQGIVKLGGENDYFNTRDIIATSDGGCVVVGDHWDLSVDPAKLDLMIVKVDPEDFITTSVPESLSLSANVTVVPNPVRDKATVELKDIPKTALFKVYDMHGRQMGAYPCSETEFSIPCGRWNSGVYFYAVNHRGERIAAGKFVKGE